MITEKSLSLFACFTHDYIKEINTAYPIITYDSGAKLEINTKTFKLTTKDGEFMECEYTQRLCVALEAQDEDVFIVLYDQLPDYNDIYTNEFNMMIYERYP